MNRFSVSNFIPNLLFWYLLICILFIRVFNKRIDIKYLQYMWLYFMIVGQLALIDAIVFWILVNYIVQLFYLIYIIISIHRV